MICMTLLFLGKVGFSEILILAFLVVLLFGTKKIPELMKGVGRGVKEFKDALNKDYTKDEETGKTEKTEKTDISKE